MIQLIAILVKFSQGYIYISIIGVLMIYNVFMLLLHDITCKVYTQ
jgi:hypothetical protein